MDPFYGTATGDVAARIEQIRKLHRNRGWGDIGYHFVVDRAGRVWEARPIKYQGAHVKDYNFANIVVLVLGNFDEQLTTGAQLKALRRHLHALMRRYRVPRIAFIKAPDDVRIELLQLPG